MKLQAMRCGHAVLTISVCLCICVHSDFVLTSQIAWYQPKSLLNREIDRSPKGKVSCLMCLYRKCEALPFCLVLNYIVPSCCHLVKIENIYTLKLIFLHSIPHTNLWEGSGNIKLSNLKKLTVNLSYSEVRSIWAKNHFAEVLRSILIIKPYVNFSHTHNRCWKKFPKFRVCHCFFLYT